MGPQRRGKRDREREGERRRVHRQRFVVRLSTFDAFDGDEGSRLDVQCFVDSAERSFAERFSKFLRGRQQQGDDEDDEDEEEEEEERGEGSTHVFADFFGLSLGDGRRRQ